MLGIFDFGQMIFRHQALVERARASIRWGAIVSSGNTTAIKNKFLYDQATVPNNPTPFLGLTASNVSVAREGVVGSDYDRITLTIVNQPFRMLSPFIGGIRTGQPIRVTAPLGMFN
jgi:hypothetical protein